MDDNFAGQWEHMVQPTDATHDFQSQKHAVLCNIWLMLTMKEDSEDHVAFFDATDPSGLPGQSVDDIIEEDRRASRESMSVNEGKQMPVFNGGKQMSTDVHHAHTDLHEAFPLNMLTSAYTSTEDAQEQVNDGLHYGSISSTSSSFNNMERNNSMSMSMGNGFAVVDGYSCARFLPNLPKGTFAKHSDIAAFPHSADSI